MQYNITYREKDKGIQYIVSYKDKHGKWRQRSKQGFDGIRVAKTAAQTAVTELRNELEQQAMLNMDYKDITFKEFAGMYIERMSLYREPGTIEVIETALKRHEKLKELKLLDITTEDIQKIIDEQTKEGLNPNTIRGYNRVVKTIFNAAINDYKIISNNPANKVIFNNRVPTNKKALNRSEINKMLNDFKSNKYYLVIFLAINTGMRLGELLGLTWDNIDFNNRFIKVDKQWKKNKNGIYTFGKLKSQNSYRDIPFSKNVELELKRHAKVIGIDNRVFSFKSRSSIGVTVNLLLKKYGMTMHELRHTYATHLIAGGMDFKTAAAILGHDVKQTMGTYSHVVDDMMASAKNIIENIF